MSEIFLICFFVLIIGACIGSFLNVVALRALSKESIVFPASKCPLCNEPIKWYDNIPVFSYFFTFKGKCRNCGCKVSIQYPLVEVLTAIIFFAVFLAYGTGIRTLLLLILLCTSIVITITDIKKEAVFDIHSWILLITAIIYSLYVKGIENYTFPLIGCIAGFFVMELIARLAYYLVRKDEPKTDNIQTQEEDTQSEKKEETVEKSIDDEDFDINEYIKKNKRAFGEADSYLAAATGALLGWKYLFLAIAFAIIVQAVCILPQFLMGLYKEKEYRLLISLSLFVALAIIYWILSNIFNLNVYLVFGFVIALIFFAVDTITRLKKTVNNQGFNAIPFGPALLFSAFTVLFWGHYIAAFLKHHIFIGL